MQLAMKASLSPRPELRGAGPVLTEQSRSRVKQHAAGLAVIDRMEVGPIHYGRHIQSCLHDLLWPGVMLWIVRRFELRDTEIADRKYIPLDFSCKGSMCGGDGQTD